MEKNLKYQHQHIFYRKTGNGSPVLLLHGFGEDGRLWDETVQSLKNKYQFIIPDLPGSGNSEAIADMTMEGLADAVQSILVAENCYSCIVIGHSMGGYISLAFAEKYPQQLKALGLFHSTAFADSNEKKAMRNKGIEFIRQHGTFEFIKNTTPNLFSSAFKATHPQQVAAFIEQQHNFKPENLVSYYKAMKCRPDRTQVLRNAGFPVLFIMGKYDTAAPLPDVLQQCHLPEKSYIHILQNTGHMGMMEEKDLCIRILDKFLLQSFTF